MLASFLVRLRALFNPRGADADLDEELRYHLERETERNVANGMSPSDARDAARRAFGNQSVHAERARDTMRWRWLDELGQDVTYAIRTFRRAPTFVATVVVTIGLGLGLMTAAFTLFDAYVLRPVAVRDPATLYAVAVESRHRTDYLMTWSETEALRGRRDLVEDAFAYATFVTRFRGLPTFGQFVSGNYFQMLGVPPAIGRTLVPADARTPGSEAVVVLSHDMWMSRFGGDSSLVGSLITLGGVRLRVVGVMARGFGGIESVPFDFWAPVTMAGVLDPGRHYFAGASNGQSDWALRSVIRLRPNVSVDEATRALVPTVRQFAAMRGPGWRDVTVSLDSHNGSIPLNSETLAAIIPVAIAFGLVLLIACANVANIMLARGMARQREVGVRLALGASRGRLIRQLLTESLLLAVPAAAASFIVSQTTIELATSAMYASAPTGYVGFMRPLSLSPDFRLFAFILSAAIGAAIAFGLAPAIQSTRPGIVHATRGDFDSSLRPSRLRTGLIAAQIGVSALLLVTAGVLLHAARSTDAISPGLRTFDVVQILPSDASHVRALQILRRVPGVGAVASAERFPLDGILRDVTLQTSGDSLHQAKFNVVSPDYFDILGIGIVRGRVFTANEANGRQNVVLVSRAAAEQLWPNEDPIGRRLRWTRGSGGAGAEDSTAGAVLHDATVIGVTSDVSPGWIGLSQHWPMVYLPQPVEASHAVIVARVSGAADAAIPVIERALTRDDSTTIQDIHSMTGSLELQRYPFHAAYWIASALGLIALLLTITGVYGVVAYVVAQRTREFGVRLALGATRGGIIALVLRQVLTLAIISVGVGALAALGMSRYMASQLAFVDAYSLAGYAAGVTAVLFSCAAAAYMPSRRAASINPVDALRADC